MAEPFAPQFFRTFDVDCSFASCSTGFDELARIIALPSTNDNDEISRSDQLFQRQLPIFCRLANRVDEADLRLVMGARDFGDEGANAINWLCCLRNNSIARSR